MLLTLTAKHGVTVIRRQLENCDTPMLAYLSCKSLYSYLSKQLAVLARHRFRAENHLIPTTLNTGCTITSASLLVTVCRE